MGSLPKCTSQKMKVKGDRFIGKKEEGGGREREGMREIEWVSASEWERDRVGAPTIITDVRPESVSVSESEIFRKKEKRKITLNESKGMFFSKCFLGFVVQTLLLTLSIDLSIFLEL